MVHNGTFVPKPQIQWHLHHSGEDRAMEGKAGKRADFRPYSEEKLAGTYFFGRDSGGIILLAR